MGDNNTQSVKTPKKQLPKELEAYKWKEGESGNPNGRPKGSGISITTEVKRKLEEVPQGQKATYLQLLISRIMKQAIQDGDQQMIKQIWNYIDGMPKQATDITSGGEKIQTNTISFVDFKDAINDTKS